MSHLDCRNPVHPAMAKQMRERIEELERALGDIEMMMSSHGVDGPFFHAASQIIDGVLGEPPHVNSMGMRVR